MKQIQLFLFMLCCLMLSHLTAWADDPNTIVFQETFDQNTTQGGRDGKFSGLAAGAQILLHGAAALQQGNGHLPRHCFLDAAPGCQRHQQELWRLCHQH